MSRVIGLEALVRKHHFSPTVEDLEYIHLVNLIAVSVYKKHVVFAIIIPGRKRIRDIDVWSVVYPDKYPV